MQSLMPSHHQSLQNNQSTVVYENFKFCNFLISSLIAEKNIDILLYFKVFSSLKVADQISRKDLNNINKVLGTSTSHAIMVGLLFGYDSIFSPVWYQPQPPIENLHTSVVPINFVSAGVQYDSSHTISAIDYLHNTILEITRKKN